MDVAFRETFDNIKDIRDKQTVRRPYFMSASIPVPNLGGPVRATLVADQDADVWVTGLNGTIIAPSDVTGRRQNFNTAFPLGMIGVFPFSGYAERGVQMRVFASSDKEDQMSDPTYLMDAKMILQPGYFVGAFSKPYPMSRYLQRDSKLTFEFYNLDTNVGAYHFVTLVLSCRKYDPFTR